MREFHWLVFKVIWAGTIAENEVETVIFTVFLGTLEAS